MLFFNILIGSACVSAIYNSTGNELGKQVIPGSYIVMLKPGVQSLDLHLDTIRAKATQFNAMSGNAEVNRLKHVYSTSGALGYSGVFGGGLLKHIGESPEVDFVEQDSVMHTLDVQNGAPWGLARVSHCEPLAFDTVSKYVYDPRGGENVTIYIIDTGVNWQHEDFQGRASWGATIPENDEDEDGNGHGSHCGGTAAGHKYGVAKKSKVVGVKVLRSNGSGTTSDVIKGIEWAGKAAVKEAQEAASSGRKHKGSFANMSLGGGLSRALNRIVDAVIKQGLHFAVAAGNENDDACYTSPASSELAITVGASTIADRRAWFSNWGRCVDIFAPGLDITSIWRGSKHATNTISGTSMASPHIAGVLAYLLSLEEKPLSHEELRAKIVSLATPDALASLPANTPNLLVFTNPPSTKSFL